MLVTKLVMRRNRSSRNPRNASRGKRNHPRRSASADIKYGKNRWWTRGKLKKKKIASPKAASVGIIGRGISRFYLTIPLRPPFPPITPFYTTVSPVDDNVRITGCSAETTLLYKEDTPPFLVAIILSFLYIYIYRSYCSILPVVLPFLIRQLDIQKASSFRPRMRWKECWRMLRVLHILLSIA